MLHEYRDIITELKVSNPRFASIFDKHNDLDQRITDAERGGEYIDQARLETMKKEKLKLK
ncbi:YdcH family protein, partial [Campylobacter sp.]|uniref:YdcH family protein n=1 Tax=Campylobacter sp. TaxID=205 RepID=UPI00270F170F|nr:YdcH family protein [Campylobacter sp.]